MCAANLSRDERLKIIEECRHSGLSDSEWCRQNNINPSTFYMWVSRFRKQGVGKQLLERAADVPEKPVTQDVVPVSIVSDPPDGHLPSSAMPRMNQDHDSSDDIEVNMNGVIVRIGRNTDSDFILRVLRSVREVVC